MFRDCKDTLNEPIRRTNNPFAESGTNNIQAFMFDKIYHHSPSTGFHRFPPVLLLGYFLVSTGFHRFYFLCFHRFPQVSTGFTFRLFCCFSWGAFAQFNWKTSVVMGWCQGICSRPLPQEECTLQWILSCIYYCIYWHWMFAGPPWRSRRSTGRL